MAEFINLNVIVFLCIDFHNLKLKICYVMLYMYEQGAHGKMFCKISKYIINDNNVGDFDHYQIIHMIL